MPFNILDTVKGYFNSGVVSQAAASLGESENKISNALNGLYASIFGTLLAKTSSSEGAEAVASMAKKTYATGMLNNPGVFFTDGAWRDKGAHFAQALFGEQANGIIENVAASAGIRTASAGTLLSVAAPLTLGVIGKYAGENNLGASGISALLSNSKNTINMSTENTGGGGHNIENASGASHDRPPTHEDTHHETAEAVTGGVRWLVPLILLAALAFLAWWLLHAGSRTKAPDDRKKQGPGTHGNAKVEYRIKPQSAI